MANNLLPHNNALVRRNPYGQIQVGGPIGWRDIRAQPFPGAELLADIIPGSAQERSLGRLNALAEERSLLEERPIRNVLNRAEAGAEYAGLAADAFPALKGLGIAASTLIPFMMRSGKLGKTAKYAKGMRGSVGKVDDLPMDEASRMKRAEAYPTDVYHGSTHDIKEFDASISNPESDWGKGIYTSTSIDDINPNYAGEGPDLTSRLTIRAEQIKDEAAFHDPELKKQFEEIAGMAWGDMDYDTRLNAGKVIARKELKGGSEGVVYPLKINTEKYARIGGDKPTYIEMPDYRAEAMEETKLADYADEWEYEDALQEYVFDLENSDMNHPLLEIRDELMRVAGDTDEAAVNTAVDEISQEMYDGITAERLDEIIRSNITYIEDYESGAAFGGGAATSAVLKRLGYDGIIDNTVDVKFGSNRKVGQMMEGVYPDTQHIITFPGSEHTVRSTNARFDPAKKNSTNILAGGAAAALGVNALMNRDEYVTKN